jgi:hypothetical protein
LWFTGLIVLIWIDPHQFSDDKRIEEKSQYSTAKPKIQTEGTLSPLSQMQGYPN